MPGGGFSTNNTKMPKCKHVLFQAGDVVIRVLAFSIFTCSAGACPGAMHDCCTIVPPLGLAPAPMHIHMVSHILRTVFTCIVFTRSVGACPGAMHTCLVPPLGLAPAPCSTITHALIGCHCMSQPPCSMKRRCGSSSPPPPGSPRRRYGVVGVAPPPAPAPAALPEADGGGGGADRQGGL